MSKAFKFKDKNEKSELLIKNSDGSDIKEVKYRSNSIIMTGKEDFILKPLFDSDSYILSYRILITKLLKPITVFNKDNIKIIIYPNIDGMSIQEIYNNIENIDFSMNDGIFFVIFIDDEPKYYIKDVRIHIDEWLSLEFSLKENLMQIFINGYITKYIYDFNTDESSTIKIEYKLNKNPYLFLTNFTGLVSNIEVKKFSEELIKLSESDFIDYRYTDYYQIRKCDSNCLSATDVKFKELNNEILFKPRLFSLNNIDPICTYNSHNIDPVTGKVTTYCSKTTLDKINSDYPTEENFKEDIIQSTHYKTQFSLNESPLAINAIIDKEVCQLVYSSFELVRPITRVANYVEYLELNTDFSSKTTSLYKDSLTLNWTSRMTAWKDVIDTGAVINIGDEVFGKSSSTWRVVHNLNTYDIICYCFGNDNELLYPDKQYPVDENVYEIYWGNSSVGGFALLAAASSVSVYDHLQEKPFVVVHNLHAKSEPDIVQMQNIVDDREREEPVNFIEDENKLIVELLKDFKDKSSVLINIADQWFYFREPSKEWNINHTLDSLGLHPQIYNEQFEVIQPKELYLEDKNNVKILFDVPQSGYVGLKRIGNPHWKNDAIENIIKKDANGNYLGKFALGDMSGSETFDKDFGKFFYQLKEKTEIQSKKPIWVPISSYEETKDSYIFEFVIDTNTYEDLNINEIGLFDADGNLCFYSCGDDIYYPSEFSFKHKFIVYKEDIKR